MAPGKPPAWTARHSAAQNRHILPWITYTAAGDLSSLPFANGITENHTWNSLLQQTGISAGNLLSLGYTYCDGGAATCSSGNTGSPYRQSIAIGGQTVALQEYRHDALNRLTKAVERAGATPFTPDCPDAGSVWCQAFSYDNAGNRTVPAQSLPSTTWDVPGFNSTTNRIDSSRWGYDTAGNITTNWSGDSLQFDAEGRMVAIGATAYQYDGEGQRVVTTDATGTTTYVYDAFGNLAAEYGTATGSAGTRYLVADNLGSTRLVMGATTERHDYSPFGVDLYGAGSFGDTGTFY